MKLMKETEQALFNNATKYTLETVPSKSSEYYYHEQYGHDNGYFECIEDLYDYCKEYNVDLPKFVWCTYKQTLQIDANEIIEWACENLHEDAEDMIDDESRRELQILLNRWCEKQSGTNTYNVDYSKVVVLEE